MNKDMKIAYEAAMNAARKYERDVEIRSQAMVYAAMYSLGYSAQKINAVIEEEKKTRERYAVMRPENMADYDLIAGLQKLGVNVEMPVSEL